MSCGIRYRVKSPVKLTGEEEEEEEDLFAK